jgi:predicted ATP-grasp superfamily ATP-dependent carboligase
MARLKVFVFDQVAGGGAASRPPPQSLRRQGDMLLQALLADLGALSDVELITVAELDAAAGPVADNVRPGAEAEADAGAGIDPTAAPPGRASDYAVGVAEAAPSDAYRRAASPLQRFGARFSAGVRAADAVWPLASGSESMLEHLSRSVLFGQRILLGSAPGAVEVAASKLKLSRVLADGGVAAVATYSPHAPMPQDGGAWVVKPDDGAGCLNTRLFHDRAAALAWIRASTRDGYVLQPFIAGKLGSLSLICCDGVARVLACNQERVAMRDNRFHFLATVVNGLDDVDGALARLAQQVAAAIPSLWGYVGVDFVLTAHGAVVLDVNPRLTTAYVGLHASIGCNPAGLVLDLLQRPVTMLAPAQTRRAVSVDIGPS